MNKEEINTLLQKSMPGWEVKENFLIPETSDTFDVRVIKGKKIKTINVDPVEIKIKIL